MSPPKGTFLNTLRIEGATLHAVPAEGGGLELHVITRDGLQAVIADGSDQLKLLAREVQEIAGGAPMAMHAAGARIALRLADINGVAATQNNIRVIK